MIWKSVIGYEELYEVSNTGEVKTLGRIGDMPNRWHKISNCTREYKPKILSKRKNKDGHLRVKLCKEGVRKHWFIHRLVAFAFVDGWFEGAIINHKDGNPANNNDWNLEWTTPKGNIDHAFANDLMKDKKGNIRKKIFTEAIVKEIRKSYNNNEITAKEIHEKYNCHPTYVYLVLDGRRWGHVK